LMSSELFMQSMHNGNHRVKGSLLLIKELWS
jgi:hypothetical protein